MIHYAIGDVHGRDDLLEQLHAQIEAHHRFRHENAAAAIVHIGDYVDRGSDPLGVIDRLMRGVDGFESVCLKGNHEDMMLACLDTDDRQVWAQWLRNGGDATLKSFGLRPDIYDPADLTRALGAERVAWLRALPLHHQTDDYLFVHAGIAPGVPLDSQQDHDLLWIRGPFLESDADHGRLVVHGHTPVHDPELRPNRLNIDTGAVFSGKLTAAVLKKGEQPRFLVASDKPR